MSNQVLTESIHFEEGFQRNRFGWVTNLWEAHLVHEFGKDLICSTLNLWVSDTKKRWPDTQFITFGEFGSIWKKQYPTNDEWNDSFIERDSGLGDSYNNLEIKWFMTKHLRLALLRDWHRNSPERIIDFTRYDLPAQEPANPDPQHPAKHRNLMNHLNQKALRLQDCPTLLSDLTSEDQEFIRQALPSSATWSASPR